MFAIAPAGRAGRRADLLGASPGLRTWTAVLLDGVTSAARCVGASPPPARASSGAAGATPPIAAWAISAMLAWGKAALNWSTRPGGVAATAEVRVPPRVGVRSSCPLLLPPPASVAPVVFCAALRWAGKGVGVLLASEVVVVLASAGAAVFAFFVAAAPEHGVVVAAAPVGAFVVIFAVGCLERVAGGIMLPVVACERAGFVGGFPPVGIVTPGVPGSVFVSPSTWRRPLDAALAALAVRGRRAVLVGALGAAGVVAVAAGRLRAGAAAVPPVAVVVQRARRLFLGSPRPLLGALSPSFLRHRCCRWAPRRRRPGSVPSVGPALVPRWSQLASRSHSNGSKTATRFGVSRAPQPSKPPEDAGGPLCGAPANCRCLFELYFAQPTPA